MHLKRTLLILFVLIGLAAAPGAQAEENQDVAKECEAQTLKVHPNKLPNTEATDKLRQDYNTICINRGGKMNPFKRDQ
jgi:hypothetical protein